MTLARRLSYGGVSPTAAQAEERLVPATAWLREAAGTLDGLAGLDLDAVLEEAEHDWLDVRGELMHVEVHPASARARASVVCAPGLGDHARRSTPLGGALARAGFNAILVDRRGHGLSEGVRGDATLAQDMALLERVGAYARERFGGPVVLLGDSLGGIMTWYLLTHEPDFEAVVCHCVSHPDLQHDRSLRWKGPLARGLARVVPVWPMPVTEIADYSEVALEPLTRRYFEERLDPLFNFNVTVRAAASYLRFEPPVPWEEVSTPALVVIGAEDRMVTPAHIERCLARARPPATTYTALPGLGHQLFLDHLNEALPPIVAWIEETLD